MRHIIIDLYEFGTYLARSNVDIFTGPSVIEDRLTLLTDLISLLNNLTFFVLLFCTLVTILWAVGYDKAPRAPLYQPVAAWPLI